MPIFANAQEVKSSATSMANEAERLMASLNEWATQQLTLTADAMTAMGVSAEDQAQIGSWRTDAAAIYSDYIANHSIFCRRLANIRPF